MQKHRKTTHYRKISIAAVTLGVVGIPTAAMACLDTDGSSSRASQKPSARPSHSASVPDVPLPGVASPTESTQSPGPTPTDATGAGDAGTTVPVVRTSPAPPRTRPSTTPAQPPTATKPQVPAKPTKPAEPTTPPTGQKPPTAPGSGPTAQVVALVNQERAKAGCSALTVNDKLTAAAQNHSQDMASHSNMSHTGSDGSDPGQRITRAGYSWSTYGENVAYGYNSPEQVMNGWMNSPGHKKNILNCAFKEIGVGLAQPNSYWTQAFGATR
ncbi:MULTISPECIES: CAP domain-containing protein [unclassified Streptomyces]|uniref:CAP domain-containing protein n=1 Tax=unclassified Streptomyces TaxID=2593676 RepID=UPI00364A8938